jgi:hypothetical protein
MKRISKMNNKYGPQLLAFFMIMIGVLSFGHAYASIADQCGQTADPTKECSVSDFYAEVQAGFSYFIYIATPIAVIIIGSYFVLAYFQRVQGNERAYREAWGKTFTSISGLFILILLFGGALGYILEFFGVDPKYLRLIMPFSAPAKTSLLIFFPHAYAADGDMLPNPVSGVDNLYDFIRQALRLIMRFFVYPALIVAWVWTGFAFVLAQGAPEQLNKAKKLLVGVFITTLVIFMIQGFILALKSTFEKVLPGVTSAQTVNNSGGQAPTNKDTNGQQAAPTTEIQGLPVSN